jgi:hypothetical protein
VVMPARARAFARVGGTEAMRRSGEDENDRTTPIERIFRRLEDSAGSWGNHGEF